MHKDVARILISEQELQKRIRELAEQISSDYEGKKPPIVVGILKGSCFFLTELAKNMNLDVELEFMRVRSYAGENSTGNIQILLDLDRDVSNENILIVEDIVDTGITLKKVKELLGNRGANDIRIAALLNKKERREVEIDADYYGFEIPNEFVVGFGLDYNQKYRNLPYIGVLKEDVYTKQVSKE